MFFCLPVPIKYHKKPNDKLLDMVTWYNLEANSIAINVDQMKYVPLSKKEQDH